jgi:hypothetical protein
LTDELVSLGQSVGLTAITPPWISIYTNGDMQNLHADAPQGPLAYVFSLSNEGDFEGGETIMLRRQILEHWKGFDGSKGLETPSIMRYIPPYPLGRCIAFDPRVPHGVNIVRGSQDPRKARVVIHGWFQDPQMVYFGDWSLQQDEIDDDEDDDEEESMTSTEMLDDALAKCIEALDENDIGRVCGYLSVRLEVAASGEILGVLAVADTLQADLDDFRGVIGYDQNDNPVIEDAVADVKLTIYEILKGIWLPAGLDGRAVVVPFSFE